MMGYSDESALKFASDIGKIKESLPNVSNNNIVRALGLDSDGLNSSLAILSSEIMMHPPAMSAQQHMFQLGIDLGRAYERKVAQGAQDGDIDIDL